MLQIRSVLFDKGDFAFTIEYFDGKCVRKIATNEEPLNSMNLAIKAFEKNLKEFLFINELYSVTVNTIRFGKKEDASPSVQFSMSGAYRKVNGLTKVICVKDCEEDLQAAEAQGSLYGSLISVRDEVEKYINGQRAQQQLDFDAPDNA